VAELPSAPAFGLQHALLLQGPAGPFMKRFARELRAHGVAVTKVNFHAGDELFFPPWVAGVDVVAYRGDRPEWPGFVRRLIEERAVDGVFVFGDCRPLHRAAIEEAREAGARVFVFEQGYLRPDWVTLEPEGVNGLSHLPTEPATYLEADLPDPPRATPVGSSFGLGAWFYTLDAIAFTLDPGRFPHYEHHRPHNAIAHAAWWVRGAARKQWFRVLERGLQARFARELSGRYFFVPLQVHCDYQLEHSPYGDVIEFIEEVVATFAREGDPDEHLVFKHHPMDRPFREYGALFRALRERHDLGERLHYVHDLHLPTLLTHARGTVTINSTVGLQSMHHETPVHVMGTAIYDMPGLTSRSPLAEFFREPGSVDMTLYEAFRRWLLHFNQANGNFNKPLESAPTPTGIHWFRGSPLGARPKERRHEDE